MRENSQRRGADLKRDGSDGHLATGLFGFGRKACTQLLKFGNVGSIVMGYMRNCVPGFCQMLRGFAADATHGDAFDFSPLREIGQSRLDKMTGARRLRC